MKMEMVWSVVKVLLRFSLLTLGFVLDVVSESKRSTYSAFEARRLYEEGRITHDEFIDATK